MLHNKKRKIYRLRTVTGVTIKAQQLLPQTERFRIKDSFVVCRVCTRWCVISLVWLSVATSIAFLALYFGNIDGWFVNSFAPDPNVLDPSDIEAISYGEQELGQPAMQFLKIVMA